MSKKLTEIELMAENMSYLEIAVEFQRRNKALEKKLKDLKELCKDSVHFFARFDLHDASPELTKHIELLKQKT